MSPVCSRAAAACAAARVCAHGGGLRRAADAHLRLGRRAPGWVPVISDQSLALVQRQHPRLVCWICRRLWLTLSTHTPGEPKSRPEYTLQSSRTRIVLTTYTPLQNSRRGDGGSGDVHRRSDGGTTAAAAALGSPLPRRLRAGRSPVYFKIKSTFFITRQVPDCRRVQVRN